jgi:hypothetical protein
MNSGAAAFRPLTKGANTKERKTIPPIQVTAARRCRTTRTEYMGRIIIESAPGFQLLPVRGEPSVSDCADG